MTFRLSVLTLPAALLAVATLLGGACTSPMRFRAKGTGGSGGGGTGGASLCTPGEKVACYDGPTGTEGQGLCRAGTQVCDADGAGFGPCEGQVLPAAEDCATPVDEDCDGLAAACKGTPLWSKRFGEEPPNVNAYCSLTDMAVTGAEVVLTGYFQVDLDFGGEPLISGGNTDLFVATLDGKGQPLWSRGFGAAGAQEGRSVAVDAAGHILVAGLYSGTLDLGGGPLVSKGKTDVFLAQLEPTGTLLWQRSFGDENFQEVTGVALGPSGAIVTTGMFSGSLDFGAGPVTSAGGVEFFVAGLDESGAGLWSQRAGDDEAQRTIDVAVDGPGNIALAGSFKGSVDFGPSPFVCAGGTDIFVVKLDASGHYLWGNRFGDGAAQEIAALAFDSAGDLLLAGSFSGTVNIGGKPLTAQGGADVLLMKLDPDGKVIWVKQFGDLEDQSALALTVDPMGNVLVAGSFKGSIDFGGGPLAAVGASDTFLAKLDGNGEHVWSKRFGGSGFSTASVVRTDALGTVFLGGTFNGDIDFGGGVLSNPVSPSNIFVAAFAP